MTIRDNQPAQIPGEPAPKIALPTAPLSRVPEPSLQLPASAQALPAAPAQFTPAVITAQAAPHTPLATLPPNAVQMGLSPTKKAEELVKEISSEQDRSKIPAAMQKLREQIELITPASKKTLEKLKTAVTVIQAGTDTTANGKKIAAIATAVIKDLQSKLEHLSPAAAATQAPAFHAATRLKKQLQETTAAKNAPEGKKLQARYEALVKKVAQCEAKLLEAEKQMQENRAAEQTTDSAANPAPDALRASLRAKRFYSEEIYKKTHAELLSLKKELSSAGKQVQLQQTDTGSLNAIFIERSGQFVFKMQSATVENRVHMTCTLMGAEDAITPAQPVQAVGSVAYAKKGTSQMKDRAEGVVQPLIERGQPCSAFTMSATFDTEIGPLLDVQDTQRKMAVQGLIGAWDLHATNAFVELLPNAAFTELDRLSWEYYDTSSAPGKWKEVSLFELTCLKLSHKIDDQTTVRNSADPLKSRRTIASDRKLQEAFQSPLKLVFFDNERAVGGGKEPQTGNPNHFNLWNGEPCLPVRTFFLGCDIALDPLQKETEEFLQGLSSVKPRLQKTLGMSHPLLFQKFSKALQNELHLFFQSDQFFFTERVAEGKSVEDLFAQMPATLLRKVAYELQQNKHIPQAPVLLDQSARKELREKAARKEMILARLNLKGLPSIELKELQLQLQKLEHVPRLHELEKLTNELELAALKRECELLRDVLPGDSGDSLINTLFQDFDAFLDPLLPTACAFEERTKNYLAQLRAHCSVTFGGKIVHEKMERMKAASKKLLAKAAALDASAKASPVASYKATLKSLLAHQLFPTIDPNELRALTERIDASKEYIDSCHTQRTAMEARLTALSEDPLPPANKTTASTLFAAVRATLLALEKLDHAPLDYLESYKKAANEIQKILRTACNTGILAQETIERVCTFLTSSEILFQPTTYGHFCHMYPHFNYLIDLLVRIENKQRAINKLPPKNLEDIRKDILKENYRIQLPSQNVVNGQLITTSINKILGEAVTLGVLIVNDPRRLALIADLDMCSPRLTR